MKARKLLNQLDNIESTLNEYSFEELNTKNSALLKKSFDEFKGRLEQMVFQGVPAVSQQWTPNSNEQDILEENPLPVGGKSNATKLIANVSHEIRTPLNGIIGFTDLLKEEKLSQNQLEKVEAIQVASNSLLEIINELLEFTKLSEGLETINQDDFNFDGVIDNILYLCNTLITNDKVVLRSKIDPSIPKVLKGDAAKLSQVLLNLIGNAIKFVEEGEILLEISLKNHRNDTINLEFVVSDTGIGISEENIKHIFGYFRQADNYTAVNYGGSGLGLNIVKQIIELLNGNIEVQSKLGRGTVFKFNLPFKKGNESSIPQKNPEINDQISVDNPLKGKKILVFEDNSMNQRLFKQRLKAWGCKSYVTDDGPAGLKFLEEHNIDLILMDLRMPGMSGVEITKQIRESKSPQIKNIPIIVVTADITAHEKEDCSAYGIDDLILKPFNPEELLMKLIDNCGRGQISRKGTLNEEEMHQTALPCPKRINLKTLQDDSFGEHDFLEELVGLFKLNILEFIGAYSVHLKNEDYDSLAFASHKIKSGLKMVQATTLLNIVLRVQTLSKEKKNLDELKGLLVSFTQEYDLVERDIDNELKKLKNEK
ncbi:ATP-binding protein [Maribacter sp. TH_r10]|uniref:ATP-binding protein n=1 Tax=Maribacter sp. TH_r10 TaxID=3082086 RepID=UPI002953014B|nr:ATP-binding protein [Maribacter sp. TH_r10]MDV7138859.1 ATP-binding protein [Maribacter sp. TH_r10]